MEKRGGDAWWRSVVTTAWLERRPRAAPATFEERDNSRVAERCTAHCLNDGCVARELARMQYWMNQLVWRSVVMTVATPGGVALVVQDGLARPSQEVS